MSKLKQSISLKRKVSFQIRNSLTTLLLAGSLALGWLLWMLLNPVSSIEYLPKKHVDSDLKSSQESSHSHNQQLPQYDPKWNGFAIALKTGKDVALKRTPIQLLTFLTDVQNVILIGEAPGVRVGQREMVDVYTGLYDKPNVKTELSSGLAQMPMLIKRNTSSVADSVVPDEGSDGWKADAHKNLPGFKVLHDRFPNADWYLMIDDDTYLFKENLKALLSQYDPSLPHYIGSGNVFMGCDGVTKWGDGPSFAHGGSGIVLSKAAMSVLLSRLDDCIPKYRTCWAGDIRTALCLRDGGVLLQDPKGFNGNPPNKAYSFGSDPCERPITFHHLLTRQTQSLYDFEKSIQDRGRPNITMADIFSFAHPEEVNRSEPILYENSDLVGSDIGSRAVPSVKACQAFCEKHSKCSSFVYDGNLCWIKSGIPSKSTANGFTAGIFPEHYICPMSAGKVS